MVLSWGRGEGASCKPRRSTRSTPRWGYRVPRYRLPTYRERRPKPEPRQCGESCTLFHLSFEGCSRRSRIHRTELARIPLGQRRTWVARGLDLNIVSHDLRNVLLAHTFVHHAEGKSLPCLDNYSRAGALGQDGFWERHIDVRFPKLGGMRPKKKEARRTGEWEGEIAIAGEFILLCPRAADVMISARSGGTRAIGGSFCHTSTGYVYTFHLNPFSARM